MTGQLKTSKILLVVSVLAGLTLLFLGRFGTGLYAVVAFGIIVVALAWNRIDSRDKNYTFQVKGPGGSEIRLKSDEPNIKSHNR
jgi:hypothetical protein